MIAVTELTGNTGQHGGEALERAERRFLKVREVALILNIGRTRAYELVASGQIPSVRIGGNRSVRVPRRLLEAWIAQQEAEALRASQDGEEAGPP
jgi:excisionase family DNA binding protein